MIRIAVVEDETFYVEQIRGYLKQYAQEQKEAVDVRVFSDGSEITQNYRAEFDIIFLDIQMKCMDGMTAAEHIRKLDPNVVLVFITNMAQYAIRGYAVEAFDFILKPVSEFVFQEKLKRAISQVKRDQTKYLTVKAEEGPAKIALNEVLYIESMQHRLMIHTETEDYILIKTMKEMEEKLSDESFFRCNNCYLVNLAAVRRVMGNEVIVGSRALQISRPRRKQFMAALTDYMGRITV